MTYPASLIGLHWLIAALVIAMIGSGLAYGFDLADSRAIVLHQWVGQLLAILVLARSIVRLGSSQRPDHSAHATWERFLAGATHLALYALLIAFVVTGYVAASGLRDPALLVPLGRAFALSDTGELLLEVHFWLKWALLGALGLHIAGALKHALIDRDGTLRNMWFPKQKG